MGTPIPWIARDGFIYGSDGSLVAESYGYIEDDNLIAAAPELLEALIEDASKAGMTATNPQWKKTSLAIAKALSQQ